MLVVLTEAIGDYILVRNFLTCLRRSPSYSGYRITLCGDGSFRSLAETFDRETFDEFIWIDRARFRSSPSYRSETVREISGRGFEICLYPSHSRCWYWGDSIVAATGAPVRIGSAGDSTNMRGWLKRLSDCNYTRLIPVDDGVLFEFERNRRFFARLLPGEELPVRPAFDTGMLPCVPISSPYAVIFPGAGAPWRRWGMDRFAVVARHILESHGLSVVIAGSEADRQLVKDMSVECNGLIDMTGKTDLPELLALIGKARILVSNETSAVHMAAAVGTPFVCISNGNHFGRFCPYPPFIFEVGSYAFPPIVTEMMNDPGKLASLFRYRSLAPIKDVPLDQVLELVDERLSAGISGMERRISGID